ncbi:MAG: hypothetical protein LC667_08530 [Thioalkalivibrio sp.]|nr:hypothetical protein [Thioalkalivibrio sp.]
MVFTPWVAWGDRAALKESGGPCLGVYLWARFDTAPDPLALPYPNLPEEIIYVGESKHLEQRPLGRIRHHRLAHYLEVFRDDPKFEHLYVSVFRVCPFPNGYESGEAAQRYSALRVYTQYFEGKLYWDYVMRWGHPPKLRYKKGTAGAPALA